MLYFESTSCWMMSAVFFSTELTRVRWGEHGIDCRSGSWSSQAKVGAVSEVVWLMATAGVLAVGAAGGGDRTAAKVGQSQHLLKDSVTLLFQLDEGFGHRLSPA